MVTIKELKKDKCSLSGKACDGVVVDFTDGSFKNIFLSWRSLKQLLELKEKQPKK